ncbi:transferase family-domain-containing protein [Xylariales sp. AK1849]|nr:transferase family-domain-containing protein [Xylariales sp. AK1849]
MDSDTMPEANDLSPLDWLMPRSYVSQVLCFPAADPGIFQILKEALRGTAKDIPHLLSGVVDQEHPEGSVRLADASQTIDDLISWQDLSGSLDYAVLKEGNFPPSSFNVASIKPPALTPPLSKPEPVFRARLSLVKGGTLLSVGFHHRTTDITGFGALLKIWASHCRTGSSLDAGFNSSWYDRGALLRPAIASTGEVSGAVPEYVFIQEPAAPPPAAESTSGATEYETRIFYFSKEALQWLKAAVNKHIASVKPGLDWVSTGDVMTALLWSATISAEQITSQTASQTGVHETCTAGIPVNFRSRYNPPLPYHYLGAAFGMTTVSMPREDLLSLSSGPKPMADPTLLDDASVILLAKSAAAIRTSVARVTEESMHRALTYIASQPDIRSIKLVPRHTSMSLVSWADQGTYELDWGELLGRCEAVRIPKMPGRRFPIVLPRLPENGNGNGGLEVMASFEKRVMDQFSECRLVRTFGSLRC